MSSINRLIQTGGSALRAHSERMATTQHNVANSSTPGYRRQSTDLSTIEGRFGSGAGPGVTAGPTRSLDDPLLVRWGMPMFGQFGQESSISRIGSASEAVIVELDLGQRATSMFADARALSARPTDMSLRAQLVDSADQMAQGLRSAHQSLTSQRDQLHQELSDRTSALNDTLAQIAALDAQVVQGAGPDVVDARDALVEQVAQELDVRVVQNQRGGISLHTSQGAALVEGQRAATLSVQTNTDGSAGLAINRSPAKDIVLRDPGGSLGGLIQADSNVIGKGLTALDENATALMQQMNAVHQAGFGLDNQTGRALFTGQAGPGIASRIAVNSELVEDPRRLAVSAAANAPGDNSQLQALIDLESSPMVQGKTLTDSLNTVSSNIGRTVAEANNSISRLTQSLDHLHAMRDSVRGVSLEEEMIALEQSRRAIEASTKLVQVGQQAMDALMNML